MNTLLFLMCCFLCACIGFGLANIRRLKKFQKVLDEIDTTKPEAGEVLRFLQKLSYFA